MIALAVNALRSTGIHNRERGDASAVRPGDSTPRSSTLLFINPVGLKSFA
jgi:hypothetical protein